LNIQAAGYPKRCLPEKVIFIYSHGDAFSFYPPSQKTTGMPVDECKKIAKLFATARCHPKDKTGILMGPRVYPWGSIGRRYAQREKYLVNM
jgi:hypothetical protein